MKPLVIHHQTSHTAQVERNLQLAHEVAYRFATSGKNENGAREKYPVLQVGDVDGERRSARWAAHVGTGSIMCDSVELRTAPRTRVYPVQANDEKDLVRDNY